MTESENRSELRLVNGDRFLVTGTLEDVEKQLSDAARSGHSRLAWFTLAESGESVAINPKHVASLASAAEGYPQ